MSVLAVIALQRTAGNAAVAATLARKSGPLSDADADAAWMDYRGGPFRFDRNCDRIILSVLRQGGDAFLPASAQALARFQDRAGSVADGKIDVLLTASGPVVLAGLERAALQRHREPLVLREGRDEQVDQMDDLGVPVAADQFADEGLERAIDACSGLLDFAADLSVRGDYELDAPGLAGPTSVRFGQETFKQDFAGMTHTVAHAATEAQLLQNGITSQEVRGFLGARTEILSIGMEEEGFGAGATGKALFGTGFIQDAEDALYNFKNMTLRERKRFFRSSKRSVTRSTCASSPRPRPTARRTPRSSTVTETFRNPLRSRARGCA